MEIKFIKTERVLSPTNIALADYVINPYRGCLLGCVYCYARANKNIQKIKKEWGKFLYIKEKLLEILEKEILERKEIKRILIGSTTEPVQPVEKKFKIFENIIGLLKRYNIPVVILTKSVLIEDYLDKLQYSDKNKIYFTYNSEIVHRLFEPQSASMDKRVEVIDTINKTGMELIVYISPVFPYLTDISEILNKLKNKTKKIYFEAYNIKIGNWKELKTKLNKELISIYEKIFFNKYEYKKYWNNFIKNTNTLTQNYGYSVKYFIHSFDSYYEIGIKNLKKD